MTPCEAFKAGFFARCVEDGLSPAQTFGLAKCAADALEKYGVGGVLGTVASLGGDLLKGTASGAWNVGLPLAIAAPPIAGGLAGYGAGRLADIDETDVREIKDREVVDEYKRQLERLRHDKAVKKYQQARKRLGGRVFL